MRESSYLAVPAGAGDGPWPGVVVLHDALGFRGDVRDQADRFAERGYLALAPNLYAHGRGLMCLLATYRGAESGRGPAFELVDTARRTLAARLDCTGRIGLIGFCMGGGYAVMSAPRFGFAAASVNYGHVPPDAKETLRGSCPVVGSFGRRDGYAKGAADRLEAALTDLDVPHDVREYETLGHGFLNDLPGFMQSRFNPMNRVLNIHLRDDRRRRCVEADLRLLRVPRSRLSGLRRGNSPIGRIALDGVGGPVFTHSIEHIFEHVLKQMVLEVLL